MDLNAENTDALRRAVEGRNSSQGYVLGKRAQFKELQEAGLVEINDAIKEGKGANIQYAVRASDAGLAQLNAASGGTGATTQSPSGTVATTTTGRPAFTVAKGVPIPARTRRERKPQESRYPFETMEIGDSFHVPPTEKLPDPVKSLASSVSAANVRFSEKVPGQHKNRRGTMSDNYRLTRKFAVYPVDATDPAGPGARVFRVELPKAKDEAPAAG